MHEEKAGWAGNPHCEAVCLGHLFLRRACLEMKKGAPGSWRGKKGLQIQHLPFQGQ